MKHYGAEPPWAGSYDPRHNWTVLVWERQEDLWDGTVVWELKTRQKEGIFTRLLESLKTNMSERVSWLEDEFLPQLKATP